MQRILEGQSRIKIAPPMSYPEFVGMMAKARLIISDSGGIQEEAPTLGVPLLVTRNRHSAFESLIYPPRILRFE